ncbi:hypothetical protein FZEAL_9473 [Fusarium zealandicum]|uniref:Zn(2)-C6 fungal-type domain-containing protein n=1 Tax=Fusarium zealandicum TaxID=1053134 RepID=A0A8H4UAM9_9HYPO|nr:hypothetical protein FZEAL_9473 [Fusarium zealandicum]
MPKRSRGCAACRQRRIGCDGGLPVCRQCQITNRQCSGPLQGPVIIDQTESTISRHQRSRARTICGGLTLYQPSSQSIFAHAFISEFVSFITARNEQARRQSWLTELQRGSIVDEGLALDLSMQATALAYCGAMSNQPAAVREACNIYGRALLKHSRSMAQDLDSHRAASLCTCVMLSFFEAICSSNPVAYGSHLRAARKLLAFVPRDSKHRHGQVIWQLGQHVQCQTMFVMVVTPQEYLKYAPAPVSWAKTAHVQDSDNTQVIDRLMDSLIYMTDALARRTSQSNCDILIDPNVGLEIGELWNQFQEQAKQSGQAIQWPTSSGPQYYDPFTAVIVSYFAASRVLFASLEPQVSSHQLSALQDSCDDVLHCSYFLEGKDIGCAHLRMFFPLTLVALYAPCSEKRKEAYMLLGQRLQTTAFKGMGSIAIKRVQTSRLAQGLYVDAKQYDSSQADGWD